MIFLLQMGFFQIAPLFSGEYSLGNKKTYPTKWAKENHQLNKCRLVGNMLVTCRASQILICIERTPSYLFPESLLYSHLSNVLVCENEPSRLCLKQLLVGFKWWTRSGWAKSYQIHWTFFFARIYRHTFNHSCRCKYTSPMGIRHGSFSVGSIFPC